MGNVDWELLGTPTLEALKTSSMTFFDITAWCADQLTDADRDFIRTFQPTVKLELGSLSILCFHGSPKSFNDEIVATTSDKTLSELFQKRAPLMFGGHTHNQLLRRFENVTFINPGSVGLPFELLPGGGARNPAWAEYALLECVQGQPSVTFRRVPYDPGPLFEAARKGGMPHAETWCADWFRVPT